MKKYCDICKGVFDPEKIFCQNPNCKGKLLRPIDDDSSIIDKNCNFDIKYDIKQTKLIINNKEMIYLAEKYVELSDVKYIGLVINCLLNNKYIAVGGMTIIDPLDKLREYTCKIEKHGWSLQIRDIKYMKGKDVLPEFYYFYYKHITMPVDLKKLIWYDKLGVAELLVDTNYDKHNTYYDKFINGDKIMIFIDPNNNKRLFLLYVKR